MTVALAWLGTRQDGREHLYLAADSRVRGGHRFDACPKIFTLPRSDCALCFAGDTAATYPLMLQLANAIAAHEPARERSLDVSRVKDHLLRVFNDMINRFEDMAEPFISSDIQFLFAGYSWVRKEFRIWTVHYSENDKRFRAREAMSFHPRLSKAAFIGDWSKRVRAKLVNELRAGQRAAHLEPLKVLAHFLASAEPEHTIGGPPQLIRITQHMNTRPLCVRWRNEDTLFGRPLFPYENTDYWIVDPFGGRFMKPRKFGHREFGENPLRDRSLEDGKNPFRVTDANKPRDPDELFEIDD
jgi:hypothetical protein